MVKFYNISYDDNWVYADGICKDLNRHNRVRVNRGSGSCDVLSGDVCIPIVRCAKNLLKCIA